MIFDITVKCHHKVAGISERTIRVCASDQAAAEKMLLSDGRYIGILKVVFVGGAA